MATVAQSSAKKCVHSVQREEGVYIRFILPASMLKTKAGVREGQSSD